MVLLTALSLTGWRNDSAIDMLLSDDHRRYLMDLAEKYESEKKKATDIIEVLLSLCSFL
jgi:hypothetical protein